MARPRMHDLWNAWDKNPVSAASRRYQYKVMAPLSFALLCWMLVIEEWVAVGFLLVILLISLEGGVRTPGTVAHRLYRRLQGR